MGFSEMPVVASPTPKKAAPSADAPQVRLVSDGTIRSDDALVPAGQPTGVFNRTLETCTGLRLPPLEMGGSRAAVPLRTVKRRPGGLLRDPVGGNVRLTPLNLGSGSCGKVVVCFNERTRQVMAVKKALLSDLEPAQMMYEANAYVHGRSVVTPFALLRGPKKIYMLQALCPGSIQALIDALGSENRHVSRVGLALLAGRHTLAALEVLHDKGWGHRDVKPANFLFVNNEVILADYGRVAPRSTRNLMPTLWYAPPEALGLMPRSDLLQVDIWSLATSLLEISGSCDERLLPLRKQVTALVAALLESKRVPRGGAYEACYERCATDDDYSPKATLTQAILTRALMLAHDLLYSGGKPDGTLPQPPASTSAADTTGFCWRDCPLDDPIRLIPDDLRIAIQNVYIEVMAELPAPLRSVVRRMLEPQPALRPDSHTLLKQLNLTILDGLCHADAGRELLENASARAAAVIQQYLKDEANPSVLWRLVRFLTRR